VGVALNELVKSASVGRKYRFRRDLIPAVRAAVRLFEPLLDAVVAKNVLAVGKPKRGLVDAFGVGDAKVVVANDTRSLALVEGTDINTLELVDGFLGCHALVGELTSKHLLGANAHLLITPVEVSNRELLDEVERLALRLHHICRVLVAVVVGRWLGPSEPHPSCVIAAPFGAGGSADGNGRSRALVAFGV